MDVLKAKHGFTKLTLFLKSLDAAAVCGGKRR